MQHLDTLPLMSRMTAGIGTAIKGLHLLADFLLHHTEDAAGEVINGTAAEVVDAVEAEQGE